MAFNAQAYAQARPDLVNNWNNVLAYRANPNDPRWASDPNVAGISGAYPTLEAYLQRDWDGNGRPGQFDTANQGGFNAQAYAQIRPDLINNWNNAMAYRGNPNDPRWAGSAVLANIASYPTLEAYLQKDWEGSGKPALPAAATPPPVAQPPTVQPPVTAAPQVATPPSASPPPVQPVSQGAFNAQAYAQARPDLVNNWNNVLAYRANPNDPRWAGDPNVAGISGAYPTLEAYLQRDWEGNGRPALPAVGSGASGEIAPSEFNRLVGLADAGDVAAIAALRAAGYEYVPESSESLPIEQGLLQMALPNLLADIEGDAGRRQLAEQLGLQARQDIDAARQALSPEENARRLAEELAQADVTSGAISASAGQAAQEQLGALQASIASMQQNLTGDLAARAAALQQQVAAFTQNLNTFDATQRAALAEQIASMQQNLEQSVAAQRQNLQTELASLRTAADAQSVARKAALQAEIDGLTAAQAPMARARLASANALTTAVNLGLEAERDRLTAERAKQGYIGSSSFTDAAQARATVGARQTAAQVMGAAREANAGDMRAIQTRGATEGRTLADQYTGQLFDIASRGATGTRTLEDILAEGQRGLGDQEATAKAGIATTTGQNLMNVRNAGATQGYQDQVMGSTQLRSLLDSLAQGTAGITATKAQQQQQARDSGSVAKQSYFDNAYTRGQGGILARPALTSDLARTLTELGNYGTTGTNRALNTLNWWSTNTGTAPTPGYIPATPSNSGNDIAGLGAGLLAGAFNLANANKWWQKDKTGEDYTNSANDD